MALCRKRIYVLRLMTIMAFMFFLLLTCPPLYATEYGSDPNTGDGVNVPLAKEQVDEAGPVEVATAEKTQEDEYGDVMEEAGSVSSANVEKQSDDYGNVTEENPGGEGPRIADPIEPFNRAMYHVNDKLYFWLFEPVARGYKYVVPEDVRGIFSSFYDNLEAPIRIVNNILQGKFGYAMIELAKFIINSTAGVGGLRDCAKECFGLNGRYADFGQTLGKYGFGHGFYLVLPLLGPSSPRDGVGWVGDWALRPTSYVSPEWFSPESVGLYVHEKINDTSFHLGKYEILKEAAIDPYVSMRDVYLQHRKRSVEEQ